MASSFNVTPNSIVRKNGSVIHESNLHIFGDSNIVTGMNCTVRGNNNVVSGMNCTVRGNQNYVSGMCARAVGQGNAVSGMNSTSTETVFFDADGNWHCSVPCTLEDLYRGRTRKMRVTRKSLSPGRPTEKVLELHIRPGMKAGTRMTFSGEGDEIEPGVAEDIVFVLREVKHDRFVREGDDLHYEVRIPLADALCGFTHDIRMLDEKERILRLNQKVPVSNLTTKILPGEGMPISKQPGGKGNLIISFVVEIPTTAQPAQPSPRASNVTGTHSEAHGEEDNYTHEHKEQEEDNDKEFHDDELAEHAERGIEELTDEELQKAFQKAKAAEGGDSDDDSDIEEVYHEK